MSCSSSTRIAAADALHSARFSSDTAGLELEYGKLMPMASIAVAIVFAVYMPPHAPGPGQHFWTISSRTERSILPYASSPYVSYAAPTSSTGLPTAGAAPCFIVPP